MENTTSFEHGYALLIGIQYNHWNGPRPLYGTERDLEDLQSHFLDTDKAAYKNENVTVLNESAATTQGILTALDDFAKKVNQDKDAVAIVYYAGHGETDGKDSFLVPYDFNLSKWRASNGTEYEENTVILSNQFAEKLAAIRAKKCLIILDCCHSENIPVSRDLSSLSRTFLDGFIEPITISERSLSEKLNEGTGRVVFTSCSAKETSLDLGTNGLFTQVLLESLNGQENIRKDGWVRLPDLINYVPRIVAERAKGKRHQQTPVFKEMHNLKGEFIICAYDIAIARGLKINKPKTNSISKATQSDINMDELHNLVGKSRLTAAIEWIIDKTTDEQTKQDAIQLKERFTKLERNDRLGMLSFSEAGVERAKITSGILDLGNEMNKAPVEPTISGKPVTTPQANTNTMKKEEIIGLIDSDIDGAFDALDNFFGDANGTYNDLSQEYFSPPGNFSMTNFRSRLKRFVKRSVK